ncbi:MAG TPA: response regulator transcription factor [Candidatus Dormibacteraeota bacterium]|nr:response regulator transcription factor [Candidatus Dormibacteraeota bacterium]
MDEQPKAPKTRVLLVDDHAIVRQGLRMVLESEEDLQVVGEADTMRGAVDAAVRTRPDVILMDVRLMEGNGIEATREIRARTTHARVIIVTSFDDDEALFAAIMAGASGYLLKRIDAAQLVRAIREVANGRSLLDPAVTDRVLQRLRRDPNATKDDKLARLTAREDGILRLVAEGKTNAQIAKVVHLSELTVKNHVSTILGKLEVARRTEAAAYLVKRTSTFG